MIDLSRKTLSTTGLGPKIILEGNLSVVSGNHNVRIKVISDTALLSLPTVMSARPLLPDTRDDEPIGTNTYSGMLNIGTNTQGTVDVTAVSSGGTTQISTTFRIDICLTTRKPCCMAQRVGWSRVCPWERSLT